MGKNYDFATITPQSTFRREDLRPAPPPLTPEEERQIDSIAQQHGFTSREPKPVAPAVPVAHPSVKTAVVPMPSVATPTRRQARANTEYDPTHSITIKGKTSVLNRFNAFTYQQEISMGRRVALWEGLDMAMRVADNSSLHAFCAEKESALGRRVSLDEGLEMLLAAAGYGPAENDDPT